MRKHFLTYLTLSTMGISQPLLDLYGRNVTLFSAAKLSRIEVGLFLVLVVLGPAAAATAVDALVSRRNEPTGDVVRLALVGSFSALVGLAASRWIGFDNLLASLLVSALCAVGVVRLFDRSADFRLWSRWASLLAVIVAGTVTVQLRPALSVADGETSDLVLGRSDVSVLLVVLDEFPLYALLGSNGTVNADRFPGFAELAADATWYRDTVAASNYTHQAVPAVLASAMPDSSSRPFVLDHPRNVFTLLDGALDIDGVEPVTNMCPRRICGGSGIDTFSLSPGRLWDFITDAGLVYLHRIMPSTVRDLLPAIDGAWGGFGGVADDFLGQLDRGPLAQGDAVVQAAATIAAGGDPVARVVHAMLPHYPWVLTPDERVMGRSPEVTMDNPDDLDGVRDNYQAMLYQLAATDAAIGRAVATLKASGRWDSTLVIVTADHGISFIEGVEQRDTTFENPDQVDDVYRVPLFVKYPGQRGGGASDCPATTLDVLPTILDVLDGTTSWTFDGLSLAGTCPTRGPRSAVSASGESHVFTGGFPDLMERVSHYGGLVPADGPASRVAAVGASARWVGTEPESPRGDTAHLTWTLDQWMGFASLSRERGSRVPALVTGSVTTDTGLPAGSEGLVVANGRVVGVVGEIPTSPGRARYTAVLDYAALDSGSYTVEMYLRRPDGVIERVPFAD